MIETSEIIPEINVDIPDIPKIKYRRQYCLNNRPIHQISMKETIPKIKYRRQYCLNNEPIHQISMEETIPNKKIMKEYILWCLNYIHSIQKKQM